MDWSRCRPERRPRPSSLVSLKTKSVPPKELPLNTRHGRRLAQYRASVLIDTDVRSESPTSAPPGFPGATPNLRTTGKTRHSQMRQRCSEIEVLVASKTLVVQRIQRTSKFGTPSSFDIQTTKVTLSTKMDRRRKEKTLRILRVI